MGGRGTLHDSPCRCPERHRADPTAQGSRAQGELADWRGLACAAASVAVSRVCGGAHAAVKGAREGLHGARGPAYTRNVRQRGSAAQTEDVAGGALDSRPAIHPDN